MIEMERIGREWPNMKEVPWWIMPLRDDPRRPYIHLPTLATQDWMPRKMGQQGGYRNMANRWGLLEEMPEEVQLILKPEGGRAGWWRLPPEGMDFAVGDEKVSQYIYEYNNHVVGFGGPQVDIWDVKNVRFHYEEVVKGLSRRKERWE
jgi:hypothetical protein